MPDCKHLKKTLPIPQKYNISLAPSPSANAGDITRQFVDLSVAVEKRLSDIEANMAALQVCWIANIDMV